MNASKTFTTILLTGAMVLASHAADFSTWGKKAEITFSGYTGAETLTNFPALVVLGASTISGFDYADVKAGGADLRFADADGNEIPCEIDTWDPAGASHVWVRVPELIGASTAITAYWGNPGVAAEAYSTNGAVWANGYVGVWHLQKPNATDSTVYANHGTASASAAKR